MSNEILPFCATDTGTNLESQAAYTADAGRTSGNQPGTASSQLVNKALRQATYVAANLAQAVSNITLTDVLDDATPAKLLAQILSTLMVLPPRLTKYTSGSGTHNLQYYFFIAAGNATTAATYTNNGVTYTVVSTITAGTLLKATGSGAPLAAGTLTKASGTGDATLTFYAVRAPVSLDADVVAGGAGGGSSVNTGGSVGAGGNSTFGSTLLAANGGAVPNGSTAGLGGTASLDSTVTGFAFTGGPGSGGYFVASGTPSMPGGAGGSNGMAGPATNNAFGSAPIAAQAGSGGGGAGGNLSSNNSVSGGGGGAGGRARGTIISPVGGYGYAVGTGGAGQAAATGVAGSNGASGSIFLRENYQ